MEFSLNVFTLNCWCIPVVSKNRRERILAIGEYLLESEHNIVCLQEIWSEKDYLYLKKKLKKLFPYAHYFYSGVLGSGLCVFSKWVIQDVFFHQWPLNGYIHKIHHGDWFGGKGVGLCRIKCGDRLVNVYCTHLHAEYHADDIYLAHRVLQAYSTAEFVYLTSSTADVSILAGDLNAGPEDLSFKIISQIPSLIDPFDMEHEGTNTSMGKPSGTSDNANNSYSDPKLVKICPEGKRIDHILYHVGPGWEANVINFGNPLKDRVPGEKFSYSDHNAVCLELLLKPSNKSTVIQKTKNGVFGETISQAIKVCEDAANNINRSKKLFLTTGGLIFFFLLGTVGYWPNFIIYDVAKLVLTGLCFYYLIMGSLWNKMELNSLKAGLSALNNYSNTRIDVNATDMEESEQNVELSEQL